MVPLHQQYHSFGLQVFAGCILTKDTQPNSFDADGNVGIEIDGELNTAEGNTNGLGFITLEGETQKTVTCKVLWKESLSDADWTVKATKTVIVGNGAQTIDIGGVGSEPSGFFKVVVTE